MVKGMRHLLTYANRFWPSDNFNVACSIIVETDSTTIASRVSRPRADTTEIVINEQTLMNAYSTLKEKMQQRIQQL